MTYFLIVLLSLFLQYLMLFHSGCMFVIVVLNFCVRLSQGLKMTYFFIYLFHL